MTKTAVDALSDEERAEIRDTFNLMDRDGDGFLTVRELGDALRAMAQHPTEQEIQDLVKKPEGEENTDDLQQQQLQKLKYMRDNGLTDLDRFTVIMAKRMTVPEKDDQLLEAFRVFDKDGSGIISAAELRYIVTSFGEKLTDEEVEEMIRDADDDGDGQISYQDFVNVLLSN